MGHTDKDRVHKGLYSGALLFLPGIGPCEFYMYDPIIKRYEFFNVYGGMEYLSLESILTLPKLLEDYIVEKDTEMDWRPVRAHYYLEKQRLEKRVEKAGWLGFFMGALVTMLFMVFVILPAANL